MRLHTPNATRRLSVLGLTLGLLGYAGATALPTSTALTGAEASAAAGQRTMPSDFIDTVHSIRFIETKGETQR